MEDKGPGQGAQQRLKGKGGGQGLPPKSCERETLVKELFLPNDPIENVVMETGLSRE